MAKCFSNFEKKQSCIRYSKRRKFRPKMRQNAFGRKEMARGREEGEGGKGRTPVPDSESAKVATLKCGVRQLCLGRIGVRDQI